MKSRVLLTALSTVLLAGKLHADVVIGDFEGSLDGWSHVAWGGSQSVSMSGIGATTGTGSMRVQGPATGAFSWSFYRSVNSIWGSVTANPILSMDVTWVAADWSPDINGNWAKIEQKVALNVQTPGWQETPTSAFSDPANLAFPGSWDPFNWGAVHTRTVKWDMSAQVAAINTGGGPGGWAEIIVPINFDPNFDTAGGVYYIDNVRLQPVPEPSMLALAGLGSAALLAVRRRK